MAREMAVSALLAQAQLADDPIPLIRVARALLVSVGEDERRSSPDGRDHVSEDSVGGNAQSVR